MSAPTSKFSKLSLGGMTPAPRSRAQDQAELAPGEAPSSTELDTDSDSSLDDESPSIVRSPSKLSYKIDKLSPQAQSKVREAFKDPPKMALQYCHLRDDVYAFQMTEMVPRSIRIGSPGSKFPYPKCSCGKQDQGPCKHLLWLLDQLTKQVNYDGNPSTSLTMKPEGYAEELGDPHSNISHFHLDVVAEGLHCEVIRPDSDEDADDDDLEPNRVRDSRELLAAVAGQEPNSFRPDIFNAPALGKNIIKRNDLECTIFRMLLDNDDFYHYFISQARPSDPVKDPFRKLEQRVDRVLRELDVYSSTATATSPDSSTKTSPASATSGAEGPRNIAWAAFHILGVTKLIRATIFRRDRPLAAWERRSAARALVRILASVVDRNRDAHPGPTILDRNLYARLIGSANDDFVVGTLLLLPDAAAPFLQDLEVISDAVGVHGAPGPFADKFGRLLAGLKKPSVTGAQGEGGMARSGSKRQAKVASPERGSKRVK